MAGLQNFADTYVLPNPNAIPRAVMSLVMDEFRTAKKEGVLPISTEMPSEVLDPLTTALAEAPKETWGKFSYTILLRSGQRLGGNTTVSIKQDFQEGQPKPIQVRMISKRKQIDYVIQDGVLNYGSIFILGKSNR